MTSDYPFMQFNQMALRVYTEEEIRKLSVLEIDQVKTFDEAGFPIKKGLYDAAMGISWAIDGVDECETCGLGSQSCPGHFGHVQLTVPAFNPLLFSFTYNLMKGTCVHCHQFTADRREKRAKFGLCDDGAMVVLDEAEDDEGEDVIAQISKFRSASDGHVKGAVADFHRLFNDQFKSVLFKRKSRCPHCKQNNGSLRNDHGRALILDFSNISKATLSKQEAKRRVQQAIMQKAEGGVEEELLRPDELPDEAIDDEQDGENYHDDEDDEGGEHVDDEGREKRRGRRKKSMGAGAAGTILDPLALSERNLAAQLRHVVDGTCDKLVWRAAEVREHFRILWRKEAQLLQLLFPSLFHEVDDGYPIDVLFVKLLLVEPILYRPIRLLRGERYEHPRTSQFRKVMEADQLLTVIRITMTSDRPVNMAAKDLVERKIAGKSLHEKLHNAYIDLQVQVNLIYDMESAGGPRDQSAKKPGLKQILERKEGLFRMNMMGKRVNYACRSVITPDPYLDVDEVGIPEYYARKLTFPEPANYFNILKLRAAVRTGPSSYPGANQVELSQGVPPTRLLNRYRRDVDARVASSMRLVAGRSTVQRHLENGDMMLMNRQPTLHKPSIMGHRARVLRSDAKALRMNYAPCKAYNADFDGDEMNGHYVQNRVAQTEAREIVNVGNNFLVPKDGTPILGLIQDHVVAGVLMTLRNTFLSRADFMKLVFAAFAITIKRLEIPRPAMLRPQRLYTGKQVISTILRNIIPEERPRINFVTKSKTPPSCWGVPDEGLDYEMSESQVIFRDGEMLCGVIDKQHCGCTQFGLVHCCYELYGSKIATKILSCFSRVFTTYLQMRGFTLGVADILMNEKADATRHKVVEKLKQSGPKIVKKALNLPDDCPVGEMKKAMGAAHYNPQRDTTGVQLLDHSAKVTLDKMSRQINDCLKGGLIRAFPDNNLQMMIQSGSKGSIVNAIQISCALGQIELEGQRPPLTAFGRSLPSFARYDPSPRAGGYVHQRFLTGIGPQELFFHTMAGREGLIDTAVKTSRSGYLQRCVIKHMEGLSVRYDNTVRDHDNSVIQFHYGEDGLDVGRAIFLHERQFPFLDENPVAVKMSAIPRSMEQQLDMNTEPPEHQFKRIMKWKRKHYQAQDESRQRKSAFLNFSAQQPPGTPRQKVQSAWQEMSEEERQPYVVKNLIAPRPVNVKFNQARMLGVLPEAVLAQLAKFQPLNVDKKEFEKIIYCKGMRAMVEPGENVGLLAAQSIGEPSTQMTLNTFHFAGRGEMNVTLGIPRLREILMTFNRNIKTPMAEVRIHADVSDQQIERVKGELNPVMLKQVLESSVVEEFLDLDGSGHSYRRYKLRLKIATRKKRDEEVRHISSRRILDELERRFFKEVAVALGKRYQEVLAQESIVHRRLRAGNIEAGIGGFAQGAGHQGADDDATSESGEGAAGELDASEVRQTTRHQDDAEYEGEAEDRVQVGDEEQEAEEAEVETIDDEEEPLSSDETTQSSLAGYGRRVTQVGEARKEARIEKVKQLHVLITSYNFDESTSRWCETGFSMAVRNKSKFDAKSLINREIERFVISRVAGIDRVIVREEQRSGDEKVRILQTQGINLEALYKRAELLDLDTLYSNDINLMMDKYGVEAAARTIVKEMNNVFGAYGIHVDARHLNLTADYMTFTGTIQPFNRHSMALSASTLQKLTFETSMNFAKEAIINGEEDELRSPSARLVTGQLLNNGGTGGFELLQRVDYILGKGKR